MTFYFRFAFNQKIDKVGLAYHRDEFNNLHEIRWCSQVIGKQIIISVIIIFVVVCGQRDEKKTKK